MTIHINSRPQVYVGQLRKRGCRHWDRVDALCSTAEAAMVAAMREMRGHHHRARVLAMDDPKDGPSYHDPYVVMEALRR